MRPETESRPGLPHSGLGCLTRDDAHPMRGKVEHIRVLILYNSTELNISVSA